MLYDTGTTWITPETPDKLAEIIRDTWPNLYRPPADFRNEKRIRTDTTPRENAEESKSSTSEEDQRTEEHS